MHWPLAPSAGVDDVAVEFPPKASERLFFLELLVPEVELLLEVEVSDEGLPWFAGKQPEKSDNAPVNAPANAKKMRILPHCVRATIKSPVNKLTRAFVCENVSNVTR